MLNIVGHGASVRGLGKRIDEHEVVRLKDPSWQFERPHDFGSRLDYLCSSTETMPQMLDCRKTPKEYWAQPKYGHYNKGTESQFLSRAKAPLKIPLELFNEWNARYVEAGMTHRNFSLGSAAIIFACEFLKPRTIFLAGFDNLMEPERLEYHKANRGKWVTHHDWKTENAMLKVVAGHYGTEIRTL